MSLRKTSSRTTTTESLLGLLSMGPMSGYEIRKMIETSIGNFWSESYGQIYPALKGMVASGLAEVREKDSEGRAKKVYSLTEAGQERLRTWLALPAVDQVPRNELLLKLFFGDRAELSKMRELVQARRDLAASEVTRLEAIEKSIYEYRGHPGHKFWVMTVRYGLAEAKALIAWCDESLEELK